MVTIEMAANDEECGTSARIGVFGCPPPQLSHMSRDLLARPESKQLNNLETTDFRLSRITPAPSLARLMASPEAAV